MGKSSTSFQPGRSGNPKGRPPKKRALTNLLERGGNAKYGQVDPVAAKRLFAQRVWEGLVTGRIKFDDHTVIDLDAQSYIALAKLVLVQVDGPPRAEVDVTSEGKALKSTPTLDDMKGLMQIMALREKDDER